jgi:hypothetical protein
MNKKLSFKDGFHTETPSNKLYDVTALLLAAEDRATSAEDWLKLSRVVRHLLDCLKESLCGECRDGDLIPTELRIRALQHKVRQLEKTTQQEKQTQRKVSAAV